MTTTTTTTRIEVGLVDGIDDPRGDRACRQAREYLRLPVDNIRTRLVYKLTFPLDSRSAERVREALTDPVIEQSAIGRLALPSSCRWVIAIGYQPGVTDNVGRTAEVFVRDLLDRTGPPGLDSSAKSPGRVYGEILYLVEGSLARADVERLANDLLANQLIERIRVWDAAQVAQAEVDLELPLAGSQQQPRCEALALPDSDEALMALSRERTLSLSLAEMKAIAAHYRSEAVTKRRQDVGLPSAPTDVELEALAQTWSEHCKHKIFNARIAHRDDRGEQVIDSLFRTYIAGSTRRVAEEIDWLVSVFDDNAGVVRLDDQTHLVYKVETHNSPSALDPVGGAMTGIVGVNRDPFGTGLGAALLTNVWGYCLGSPDHDKPLPEGLLHPRRIRDGVHRGVIEGGNQSGIPYSRGWEIFDERYTGKPLVFCGTVGVMPPEILGRPSEHKEVIDGDVVVMVGGRIGKDGIHGATFSSEALHGESPAQAVQIGDPITQKMMTDMLLEARDSGLYRAITDNGAGGLSSSVGEMAQLVKGSHGGGAELDLERAPLKYAGLQPWEILLSEAQERMTLAVPPDKLDELLALARRREVEATPIGHFNSSGRFVVRHEGEIVADLEMAFLHGGCPQMSLQARFDPPPRREPSDAGIDPASEPVDALLLELLGGLNLCSKERSCRQYDHEVKGLSVIKPLTGVRGDVPSDATVMRVAHGREAAILLADGIAPFLSDIDGLAMGRYVVDLAVRRIVAGGGRLGSIAGLDNFCWPDPVQSEQTPDGHHKLATLVRCCQGLAEMTEGLGVPLISGKDSMKNDARMGGEKISIPPTLLFSALGWMPQAQRAIDLTIPAAGHLLYLVGSTGAHLGGSELYRLLGQRHGENLVGRRAPEASAGTCRTVCAAVEAAVSQEIISAAHAPHLGGLGVGLAMLCLASDLGLRLQLDAMPTVDLEHPTVSDLLFSESGARLLVATAPQNRERFEALLEQSGAAWCQLGVATPQRQLSIGYQDAQVTIDIDELRRAFHQRGM